MAGGSLIGSLFSDVTSSRFGRRDTLFYACMVFIVGSILMCAVQDRAMLIVARVVNGFAVGMLTSQGPIYIAEISTPQLRGRLISFQQWSMFIPICTHISQRSGSRANFRLRYYMGYSYHVFRIIWNQLHYAQHGFFPAAMGFADDTSMGAIVCHSFHAPISSLAG